MKNLKEKFIKLGAAGLGSGFIPAAPGTAGTLAGILFFLVFSAFSLPVYLLILAVSTCGAVYLAQAAETLFGKKDPPCIVIDEIVGFLWAMICIPPTLIYTCSGFILFRLFDIAKPFPIRRLQDKLPGGYGVVGDDVMAGIYTNIVLRIIIEIRGL